MLILLQSFSKVWIVLSFKINQDYIAKVLCINRDKPAMKCNGKCVLKQRIKADEEEEQKEMLQKLKGQKEVLYCIDNFNWPIECPNKADNRQKKTFPFPTPFTLVFVKGIFRPPKFVTV